jgi:hypothetical protein
MGRVKGLNNMAVTLSLPIFIVEAMTNDANDSASKFSINGYADGNRSRIASNILASHYKQAGKLKGKRNCSPKKK